MKDKFVHSGPTNDGRSGVAQVLAGRVIDVDQRAWTCRVRTEVLERTPYDVLVGSPYLDASSGAGIHAMPCVGDLVYIAKSSEGDAPWYIAGYRAYPSKVSNTSADRRRPSAPGNRLRMAPGDMAVVGADKNGLFVRRGQFTEVVGGPLARTAYIGRSSEVRTVAGSVRVDTLGGSAHWLVDRAESDPDGHRATRLDASFREFASNDKYAVRVEVGGGIGTTVAGEPDGEAGEHPGAPASPELVRSPVLRVRVLSETGDVVAAVSFDKNGQVEVSASGDVLVASRSTGSASIRVGADGTVSSVSSGTTTSTAGTELRHVVGGLTMHHTAAGVAVGEAPVPVVVDRGLSASTAAAWVEVLAICSALGLPSAGITSLLKGLLSGEYASTKLGAE